MGSSRRDFFRQVVDRAVRPAAEIVGGSLERLGGRARTRLRPPGAIPEAAFLETCYRCGNCVDACPAVAIQHIRDDAEELNGTPFIEARSQPCLVCASLACMTVCPSGALQPVSRTEIRMGRAVVAAAACQRTHGQDCRECVDLCPFGEGAIHLDAGGAVRVGDGCTGCGICEWRCPAAPAAVVVRPAGALG